MGMCSCVAGETGAVCKHQIAVADATMTALPQLFITSMENRQLLAEVALGEANVPKDIFKELVSEDLTAPPEVHATASTTAVEDSVSSTNLPEAMSDSDDDFISPPSKVAKRTIPDTLLNNLTSTLKECVQKHGDEHTSAAINKFINRLQNVRNPNSLNSFLHSAGSTLGSRRGHGRGKIPVQPTSTERRRAGMPRGASTVGRGRPPALAPAKKLKRKHNLALNVAANLPSAK